jgi:uncharacterized protein YbjT (DUF2867 family)
MFPLHADEEETMTDTVLVLGATGTTGRRLVPRLAARGVQVKAASRQPGEGRTLFEWDQPSTYEDAVAGADADMEATRNGSSAVVTDSVLKVADRPATRFADYAARAAEDWARP